VAAGPRSRCAAPCGAPDARWSDATPTVRCAAGSQRTRRVTGALRAFAHGRSENHSDGGRGRQVTGWPAGRGRCCVSEWRPRRSSGRGSRGGRRSGWPCSSRIRCRRCRPR